MLAAFYCLVRESDQLIIRLPSEKRHLSRRTCRNDCERRMPHRKPYWNQITFPFASMSPSLLNVALLPLIIFSAMAYPRILRAYKFSHERASLWIKQSPPCRAAMPLQSLLYGIFKGVFSGTTELETQLSEALSLLRTQKAQCRRLKGSRTLVLIENKILRGAVDELKTTIDDKRRVIVGGLMECVKLANEMREVRQFAKSAEKRLNVMTKKNEMLQELVRDMAREQTERTKYYNDLLARRAYLGVSLVVRIFLLGGSLALITFAV